MEFLHDKLQVQVFESSAALANSAAEDVAAHIREILGRKSAVNIVVSGAESQQEFHRALANVKSIDWQSVHAFAVDEFHAPGISPDCAVSSQPMRDLYSQVHPKTVNLIDHGAENPLEEAIRYERLIRTHPPDIVCLGIGVSGHIALNEPKQTTFNDPQGVRYVALTEESKNQLMDDPNFRKLASIPSHGITITASELMRCPDVFVIVPYKTKAAIIRRFFTSEVTTNLPATILKKKQNARLYLDQDSFCLAEELIA